MLTVKKDVVILRTGRGAVHRRYMQNARTDVMAIMLFTRFVFRAGRIWRLVLGLSGAPAIQGKDAANRLENNLRRDRELVTEACQFFDCKLTASLQRFRTFEVMFIEIITGERHFFVIFAFNSVKSR